jgi:hypothetical protein
LALILAWGAAVGAAQAGKATKPLNDTGVTQCVVNAQLSKACSGTGQDGEFGRDVTKKNNGDGKAGFAYAQICNSGELAGTGTCPVDPPLGAGVNKWGCTLDKVTGLIWEIKTADGGLHDWKKVYSNWGDGRAGDVGEWIAQVNAQGLCGASDWKQPTVQQLQGLLNLAVPFPGPAIDKNWFPHTAGGNNEASYGMYWAADGYATDASSAWYVSFVAGYVGAYLRGQPGGVRLVRVGP